MEEAFDASEAAAEATKKGGAAKGGKGGKGAPAAPSGKKAKPVEMKIEGDFYSLVKGKQLDLRNGALMAPHPSPLTLALTP